jgi:peptidoglycan/xylan/chitin deacetylase (PgdA/CDA1 family)
LERYDITCSWFVPGHSIETFPAEVERIVAAGHEIGLHGYSHENPISMSLDQEQAVLEKSLELAQRFTGKRPTGYVAPWWEFSDNTAQLLIDAGIEYDHSLMHNDFLPYYVPTGAKWTPIDYDAPAADWMKPMNRGEPTSLVEIPANWYLDDLPPMMFVKKSPNSHGFVNPRDIEQLWRDQFDWVYREMDYAAFTIAIHPDVSGRPQVLLMLERLIEYINGHAGVTWKTFHDISTDFKARNPR